MTNERSRLLPLLLAVAGCAAALQANKRSPGTVENGMFKPQRPPAANYGPDPSMTCPGGGANGALETEISTRNPAVKPVADGRLCAMADTLLGWKQEGKDLPPESIRTFLAQYFGIPGTIRQMLITDVESEEAKQVAEALGDPLVSFAASAQKPIYGLMTERVKKKLTHVVLVMYDATLELDAPLPRKLAAGQAATLSGHVNGEYTRARLEVVDASGKLQKIPDQPGKAVKADLKCGDRPGRIMVQASGRKEESDSLVASFPVYCNADSPVAAKMPAAAGGPVDVAQGEKQLMDSINGDRHDAGAKALNTIPALSEIARKVATKRAAGQGTSSSELVSALKEADISAPMILESMAQGFGIEDLYTRLSDSPPDRANAMNPDLTDAGVGVAKGPVVGDKPTYIVAVLYLKQSEPIDPADVKVKLYAAMDERRADAKADPLSKDAVLEDVAQKYADAAAAAGGQVPPEKTSEILAPLYKQSMTVNQVGGFLPDAKAAMDVAQQPSVVGKGNLVGVGVALGRSPQFGKNAPFVVVFFGTRHAKPAARPTRPGKKK